ncbi:MAG: hypothetical protein M3461_21665 [Pseudomonadota bacterium]|nr:hypothetical protein [Pseudomonadota bacterium]
MASVIVIAMIGPTSSRAPARAASIRDLPRRRFELVRRAYAWLLDGALQMRWAIVAAALLVMAAAWPLQLYSRQELAPVEDQSHISLFLEASPDSSFMASNRASLNVVDALRSFP